MIEDKNFNLKTMLNAELAQLMGNLQSNTSPIGDWKIIKIYEARMTNKEDPYNLEELIIQRQTVRDRINMIQTELEELN